MFLYIPKFVHGNSGACVNYSLENSGSVVNAWSNNAEVEAMMTEIMQKIAYKQYGSMEEAAQEVMDRIAQIAAANPA